MRAQRANERRTVYLMRVAAEFIKKHALYDMMHYDEADCDGGCLSEELLQMAEDMDVKEEKVVDKPSSLV